MDTLRALFFYILGKIRERAFVYCEVLVAVHVIYIEIHAVERNTGVVIAVDNRVDRPGVVVAPAALLITERPLRRNVALAYRRAELTDNIERLIARNNVNIKILAADRNFGGVPECIAYIPAHTGREIDK